MVKRATAATQCDPTHGHVGKGDVKAQMPADERGDLHETMQFEVESQTQTVAYNTQYDLGGSMTISRQKNLRH